jgi:hypothetical protein
VQQQSGEVLLYLPDLNTLILPAAFLMLTGVVPAVSASAFKRPSLLNDASHKAAAETHGFLPAKTRLFLSKMSSAVSTTDAGKPALAAGLYVVLNGDHLSIPTEGPRRRLTSRGF